MNPVTLPPGCRQAVDEPGADRVSDLHEHGWHGAGRLSQRRHGCLARGQDDVGRERDQFGRCANAVSIGRGPADVEAHVAVLAPTQLRQPLLERVHAGLIFRIARAGSHQHADAPHPIALLRASRKRPRRCAAKERDEIAPPHLRPGPATTD
jgi:hypothetical protein